MTKEYRVLVVDGSYYKVQFSDNGTQWHTIDDIHYRPETLAEAKKDVLSLQHRSGSTRKTAKVVRKLYAEVLRDALCAKG